MTRLKDLSSQELAALAQERARVARLADERLGKMLDRLVERTSAVTKRLDDADDE